MKLTRLILLMVVLCAACTGSPTPFELPTLAVLPSVTPTFAADAIAQAETPTQADVNFAFTVMPANVQAEPTITLPVPTEQLEAWYTTGVTAVYSCPQLTCDILASFPAGVQLYVIVTEEGWHEVLLARQRGRYVEARLTTQATPQPSTATAAASAQFAADGQGSVPPVFVPGQVVQPTISGIDDAPPPVLGTEGPRPTLGPTATFNLTPPTVLPPVVSSPTALSGSPTATPMGTLPPPNTTGEPTATFILPNVTVNPPTATATARFAPPGLDPNAPTATPFVPRPPGT